MKKWEQYVRTELEAEIMACVHGFAMAATYLIEKVVTGSDGIGLLIMLEMGFLGWIIAWIQKLVFLREKKYSLREYRLREAVWCLAPELLLIPAGQLLGWFRQLHWGYAAAFYVIMLAYFIVFWWCIRRFFRKETRQLNQWLEEYKESL